MPTVTTYVSNFDSACTTDVSATLLLATPTLSSDSTIAKNISISDAAGVFKILYTDNSGNPEYSGSFATNTSLLSAFKNPVPTDVLKFTSKLSNAIFGFNNGVELFTNEGAVKADIVSNFNAAIDVIEAGGDSSAGNAGCMTVFNSMKVNAITRFDLGYSAVIPSGSGNITGSRTIPLYDASGNAISTTVKSFTTSDSTAICHIPAGDKSYIAGKLVWFIHPVTGQIYHKHLSAGDLTNFNATNASDSNVVFNAVTTATLNREFSKFYLKGTSSTDATPLSQATAPLVVTKGTNVTDLTITTPNTSAQTDFVIGNALIMVSLGADGVADTPTEGTNNVAPEAIVIDSINSIQTAYLNGAILHADGVSLPFEVNDVLQFKLTVNAFATQKKFDGTTDIDPTSHSYGLVATLTA